MNSSFLVAPPSIIAPAPGAPGTRPGEAKWKIRRIRELLLQAPPLEVAYSRARSVIRRYQTGGYYEITQRCNLKCEGCYYFESEERAPVSEEASLAEWERHFAAEKERGVSMGFFLGAEPALEQERLKAASRHIPFGTIGSNGTMRIDPSIPYKIHLSVWGDNETDGELRGGSVFSKALRNYRGDSRAIALYTMNRRNIPQARGIVERCREHGITLTFNMYSPTTTYLQKLREAKPNDREFFRVSSAKDNLMLTPSDHVEIRATAEALLAEFPETVVYSNVFNRFITSPDFHYDINPETGVAENCRSRIVGRIQYFTTDLKPAVRKCGTPDVNCADCRMFSGGWAGRLDPRSEDLESVGAFTEWLDMVDTLQRIFLHQHPADGAAEIPVNA